jgi:ketosteroid isomerase-like protein
MTVAGGNRRFVRGFYEAVGSGDLVEAFEGEEIVRLGERLAGAVTDDFECVMVGPFEDYRYEGLDGFREAWRDWIEPYSSFKVRIEDVEERDESVLILVRQRGVTRRDQVEIEDSSAAVWRFRDGKLARAEFYLDRDRAREAFAGDS